MNKCILCNRIKKEQEFKSEIEKKFCFTCWMLLNRCKNIVSPRVYKILEMRFGLNNGQTSTLEEVGQKFGVTRERIRQLENKAIQKIKRVSRKMYGGAI